MKPMIIVAAAIWAVASTTAPAQPRDACSSAYVGCIDRCVASPAKSMHDSCIEKCQSSNNMCAAKMYGPVRPATGVAQPAQPAQEPAAANASAAKPDDEPRAEQPRVQPQQKQQQQQRQRPQPQPPQQRRP